MRAIVPHDNLGDHVSQRRVAHTRNDQDDILESTPIEDNCGYARLVITAQRSSDRVERSVVEPEARSSVGDQRWRISWIIGIVECGQLVQSSASPRLKYKGSRNRDDQEPKECSDGLAHLKLVGQVAGCHVSL